MLYGAFYKKLNNALYDVFNDMEKEINIWNSNISLLLAIILSVHRKLPASDVQAPS